ncbi:MAG: UDP-N-acetylmuramoyl-L-alanine--D-glutamate ligase [Candidatus Pacebacteria bacterium]|nr:UDP-N-acetylmuramoyl-L-alanine--D-glutamate ligase [Candidatus Paceibacterota bacterium]
MKISQLGRKNVIILGFGREGYDTYSYLRKIFPAKTFIIADKRRLVDFDEKMRKRLSADKSLVLSLGDDYLDIISAGSVIIRTPGISMSSISKRAEGCFVTSQTELFFDNCPARIIGVTGTKGKSTTSSLVYSLLKNNKMKTYLLGNIEKPALSYLSKIEKTDWVVYELSCHQLQNLQKSPHISIFLNLYPEHLDYYRSMKEYFLAKANIFLHQKKSDYLIFNPQVKSIVNMADEIVSKKMEINKRQYEDFFKENGGLVSQITHDDNIVTVLEVAKILKIPEGVVLKTMKGFEKLPHRLEYVGNHEGVDFYDDSIATIPEALIHALNVLGDNVETLIVGGLNRGIRFDKLGKRIKESNVKNIVLFPDSGKEIKNEILKYDPESRIVFFDTDKMEEAISFVFKKTVKGKICLLSPASPSFNIFKDYKERGEAFKKVILSHNDEKNS